MIKRSAMIPLFSGILLAAAMSPIAKAADQPGDVSVASGDVVVRGARSGPLGGAEVLTSVNILGSDQIRRGDQAESIELLRRVPAVYMETFNQGIISADIGIRGFSTQGDVAHVKLLIDGIPSNLHTGYADMKSIFPLEIDRIEVVKGTNDARYGLNNVAGNINVITAARGNERAVRLAAGSFGTIEPQAIVGIDDGRLSQTYFLGYRGSNGYRENAGLDRVAGSAKWFYQPLRPLKIGLIVRGMYLDADAPGYLGLQQARETPAAIAPFAAADGGVQRNLHASAHVDYALSEELSWSFKAYGQSFLRKRWVRWDAESSQQERLEDEDQYGAISTLTYRTRDPAMRGLSAEWGIDYQLQDNIHQRFTTTARKREAGEPLRDHAFTFHTFGTFLQASARPLPLIKITAGLRVDRVAGHFVDKLKGTELDVNDYGTIWQPKASVVFTPWRGQSLYANYGRTFQIGTGMGAYATQDESLAPSLNDGIEIGYKLSPAPWFSARVAYFRQYASREVRLKYDDSGESENIGETLRHGFDAEATLRLFEKLSIWGAVSRVLASQIEPGPAFPDRKDKLVDHVPGLIAKGGIDYQPLASLLFALWFQGQTSYFLTKENEFGQFGQFALINASALFDATDQIQIGAELKNILGLPYDSTVFYKDFGATGTMHNPGEPRAFYVTTTVSY